MSAGSGSSVRLWINGAVAAPRVRVFGMGLIERHLRAVNRLQPLLREIALDLGGQDRSVLGAPSAFVRTLPLTIAEGAGPVGARLRQYLDAAGNDAVLAVAGDSLVDPRLFIVLARSGGGWLARGSTDGADAVILRLERAHRDLIPEDAASLAMVAAALERAGALHTLQPEDFPSFVRNLRRAVPHYVFTVRDDAARRRCERFLFGSNYKGSTDVLTKYVYPPAVWVLTKALADARVHPNVITGLSILFAAGAIPLFAIGDFLGGLILAYAMSLLDSVDGKLARLTFADSRIGNVLDHGLDIVHPPLWYAAWAWGLGGGAQPAGPLWTLTITVIACYVLDRLVLAIYPAIFKRGLHTHAPIDAFLRTFIARRNTNLIIISVGLLAGQGVAAFYAVVLWQALTLAYHAGRTFWILLIERARPPRRA